MNSKGDPLVWGRKLIETHDHDPLYTGLVKWNEREGDGDRLRRFMVAYWCCTWGRAGTSATRPGLTFGSCFITLP